MTDDPRPELPDLLTEELPEDVLDDSELFSADESADPLPPSHRTVAGLGEVRDALRDARRVYYYPTRASEDDKAPLKLLRSRLHGRSSSTRETRRGRSSWPVSSWVRTSLFTPSRSCLSRELDRSVDPVGPILLALLDFHCIGWLGHASSIGPTRSLSGR